MRRHARPFCNRWSQPHRGAADSGPDHDLVMDRFDAGHGPPGILADRNYWSETWREPDEVAADLELTAEA